VATRSPIAADCLQKVGSFTGDPDFKIKLIDNVYGGRNGNRPSTHDGSTFIGRGLSQVTGRGNYEALATTLDDRLDLVNQPDLVNAAANALECGVADFVMCGCLPHAAQDDLLGVSALLNLGHLVNDFVEGGRLRCSQRRAASLEARPRRRASAGAQRHVGAGLAQQTRRRSSARARWRLRAAIRVALKLFQSAHGWTARRRANAGDARDTRRGAGALPTAP